MSDENKELPREDVIQSQADLIEETFEVSPEELEKLQGGATPVFAPMYGIPFRPVGTVPKYPFGPNPDPERQPLKP
jgi:hypothetical protein